MAGGSDAVVGDDKENGGVCCGMKGQVAAAEASKYSRELRLRVWSEAGEFFRLNSTLRHHTALTGSPNKCVLSFYCTDLP